MRRIKKSNVLVILAVLAIILILSTPVSAGFWGWFWGVGKKVIDFFCNLAIALLSLLFRGLEWMFSKEPCVYSPSGTCLSGGSPDKNIVEMVNLFLTILIPIYEAIILILALFLVLLSLSPQGRAKAKTMLQRLVLGMVLVVLCLPIYQILIDISGTLTTNVFDIMKTKVIHASTLADALNKELTSMPTGPKVALLLVIMQLCQLTIYAFIVLVFRYLMVVFFAVMFPFTLFLFTFDLTRDLGRSFFKSTLVWIFTPPLMALWLSIGMATIQGLNISVVSDPSGGVIVKYLIGISVLMVSMIMMIVSPLFESGLMAWIGAVVTAIGFVVPGWWGFALTFVGGLLQGRGAQALATAGLATHVRGKVTKATQRAKAQGQLRRGSGAAARRGSLAGTLAKSAFIPGYAPVRLGIGLGRLAGRIPLGRGRTLGGVVGGAARTVARPFVAAGRATAGFGRAFARGYRAGASQGLGAVAGKAWKGAGKLGATLGMARHPIRTLRSAFGRTVTADRATGTGPGRSAVGKKSRRLEDIRGVDKNLAGNMRKAGLSSVQDVAKATPEQLRALGISDSRARKISQSAKTMESGRAPTPVSEDRARVAAAVDRRAAAAPDSDLTKIDGVGRGGVDAQALKKNGYNTIDDVANANPKELAGRLGIPEEKAESIVGSAREKSPAYQQKQAAAERERGRELDIKRAMARAGTSKKEEDEEKKAEGDTLDKRLGITTEEGGEPEKPKKKKGDEK